MAIFGNLTARPMGQKGVFEASLLKSTISGHLWDCLLVTESGTAPNITRTPIAAENGVCVKVGDFTNNDNGLQERYATIAGVKDKIGVTGSVVNVKDARTKLEETEPYFEVPAGEDCKVYEVIGDQYDGDIFGVCLHQFTAATQSLATTRGNYVVLDGNGKYVASASKPTMANFGFVAQVHSTWTNNDYTLVRLYVIQNEDNNP